ncbi:MAG: tyrosine-type recombinase/integrase, partial [Acetatifactor sp.]
GSIPDKAHLKYMVEDNDDGKALSPRYLDRMLRKIAVLAGFSEERIYGLHSLRHSFASRLFENGEDVKTVSEILGHSDITITYNTYIHLINDQKKTAIANMNKKSKEATAAS